jgi:hypothetical protein
MTTATIRNTVHNDSVRPGSTRPHGIERLAVQFGLALVKWGQVRAERASVSRDRHAAMLDTEHAIEQRERAAHRYGIAG